MPFVSGGQDPQIDPLQLIRWLTERKQQQGKNILDTADPGATVGSTGMDPKIFAALFGKNVPYDRNRILKRETATDLLDRNTHAFIQSLSPSELANLSATQLNAASGTPGQTTRQGLADAQATGAAQAATGRLIAETTSADQVATAKAKSGTQLIQANTARVSATDVARRVMEGIDSMSRAPKETQEALGQTLAFGTTADALTNDAAKQRLATSAVKQAIIAQTDPNHPLHKFLRNAGLDLNTVLAGTAMGIGQMFEDYARYQQNVSLSGKEASNILLRMYADDAKTMSEKVFAGKLSPGQILSIVKSREDGTPLPKGLEAASAIYDRAAQAGFDANLQKAITDGDPYLTSLHEQIKLLEKQTDPGALSSVAAMVRQAAGYAMTKAQMRTPTTPDQWKTFNKVWEQNTKRAAGVKYDAPWFGSNSWKPVAGPGGSPPTDSSNLQGIPGTVADAMRPRPAARMGAMPPALGVQPVAGAAPAGNPVSAAAASLSPEDQAAIMGYLQTLGVGTPKPAAKPPL